ncbi:hypothetical protein [Vibrio owensii]|uniref:Uncharacterized protein n=1 Tax=Vibrio owensii CAIM 1854 = LMG 25443 TaxID=1229493 RepID=A0A0C1ZLU7_9VIBR|nr:hypothetical protein [Vibrio owensii]KIF54081.1 hypothetical protein H735_06745 [Vibrio owensii CAIM 1854 = LMG 25443]
METPSIYSSLIGEITFYFAIEQSVQTSWELVPHEDPNDNYMFCTFDGYSAESNIIMYPATDKQTGDEVVILELHHTSEDSWTQGLIDDINNTGFGYKVVFVDVPVEEEE